MRWIGLVLGALFLVACDATATPLPPPVPTATAPTPAGGLGVAAAIWEQQHGPPHKGGVCAGWGTYEGTAAEPKYQAGFWPVGDNPVRSIDRWALNRVPMSLDLMHAEAHGLLPPDAQAVQPQIAPELWSPQDTAEVFTSPSLRDRYQPHAQKGPFSWGETAPGTILVAYDGDGLHWSMQTGYSQPRQLTQRQIQALLTPSPTPDC